MQEFKTLAAEVKQCECNLSSLPLTDEERGLYTSKIDAIKSIFDFLECLMFKSERQKGLINLCLEDGNCTIEVANRLGFTNVHALRAIKSRLKVMLSETVLNSSTISAILHCKSITELEKIMSQYRRFILNSSRLKRYIAQDPKG